MILKVFAVLDTKVAAYMQPFFMRTTGEAVRAFSESVNDKSTMFYKNPADFTLFHLSDYNDMTGQFESPDHPKVVLKASDVHRSVRDQFEEECA